MSRGSRRHGSCYGEVTEKFRGFKPSQHVEMVFKIPATSRQPARFRRGNGEIGDVSNKSSGTSRVCRRTCRGHHGEVGITRLVIITIILTMMRVCLVCMFQLADMKLLLAITVLGLVVAVSANSPPIGPVPPIVDVYGHSKDCFKVTNNLHTVTLRIVSWWRSIVVRPPVLAGELSLSCARLMAGRVTTVGKAFAINQPTWPTQPAIPPGSVK